jgi:hypothetical protein
VISVKALHYEHRIDDEVYRFDTTDVENGGAGG